MGTVVHGQRRDESQVSCTLVSLLTEIIGWKKETELYSQALDPGLDRKADRSVPQPTGQVFTSLFSSWKDISTLPWLLVMPVL